jgi:hypothetical protein
MNFKCVSPCPECPFRNDIAAYLTKGRVGLMERELLHERKSFSCHKTVDYSRSSEGRETKKSQHCAGAMILMEKMRKAGSSHGTTAYELAHRLALLFKKPDFCDISKLDMAAPVFDSFEEMRAAQES